MAENNQYAVIADREHAKIRHKKKTWKLISDSYDGGQAYTEKGYLEKYPREPNREYTARKRRAVFLNHVQPLADLLAGFVYAAAPERTIPKEQEYLLTSTSKRKPLDNFMLTVATQSALYTVGVLVDSPQFDAEEVQTAGQRKEKKLNPYAVLYFPWQIRDFALDDNGELEWILLDNTYCEKEDPLKEPVEKVVYRLWERNKYTDFEIDCGIQGKKTTKVVKEYDHNLGKIPFKFVNWRDKDDDMIAESPFEDIALLDKAIFNNMSYMDEMLAAGTFKTLFFPVETPEDLPSQVKHEGIGGLSVIPYKQGAAKPFFDGAQLGEITSFLDAVAFYLKEIFRKLGLDTDEEKKYVQSGEAKSLEFQKCEALLRHGAKSLEDLEVFIVQMAALWEGKEEVTVEVKYAKSFQSEEIDAQLARLYEAFALPYEAIKNAALEKIVRKVFKDNGEAEIKKILKSTEKETEEQAKRAAEMPDTEKLVTNETESRQATSQKDDKEQ